MTRPPDLWSRMADRRLGFTVQRKPEPSFHDRCVCGTSRGLHRTDPEKSAGCSSFQLARGLYDTRLLEGRPGKASCPNWHPDHGDPAEEIKLLRSFYDHLQPGSGVSARLVEHEPGYLSLLLDRDGSEIAEVMIVEGEDEPRFGVFLRDADDEEHYFTSAEDAAALFDTRSTLAPRG